MRPLPATASQGPFFQPFPFFFEIGALLWVMLVGMCSSAYSPKVGVRRRTSVYGTQALGHPGSVVVVRGLNYPAACGNFPDQGEGELGIALESLQEKRDLI